MERKHSYRQQAKREFNKFVLNAITNKEEMKDILNEWIEVQREKESKFLANKIKQIEHAINTAKWLMKECKEGQIVTSRYAPYSREIKAALIEANSKTKGQTELNF